MIPDQVGRGSMSDEAAQRELDTAIRDFGEAWARGDVDALRGMLSPDYTHTDVRGRFQGRDEWLEYARGRSGAATQIRFADVTTRVMGDVAIITGRNDMVGGNIIVGDERSGLSLRFTQIWLRRDGRWLREAFQATIVDPLAPLLNQQSSSSLRG
jgi:ketosteroid isomerase-like protein